MSFSKHAAAKAFFAQVTPEDDTTTKEAGFLGAAKDVVQSPMFWGPLAMYGASKAIDAGESALQRMALAKNKGQAYQQMLAQNPTLRNYKPEDVQKFFNTLYTVNPHLATDPTVAGHWVGMHARQEAVDPEMGAQGFVKSVGDMAGIAASMRGKPGGGGIGQEMMKVVQPSLQAALDSRSKYQTDVDRLESQNRSLSAQNSVLNTARRYLSPLQEKAFVHAEEQRAKVPIDVARDVVERHDAIHGRKRP